MNVTLTSGIELKIGDKVVVNSTYSDQKEVTEIVGFTPKRIKVKVDNTFGGSGIRLVEKVVLVNGYDDETVKIIVEGVNWL